MRITEVGVELALASVLYSARTGIPLPGRSAIAGELTLAGELRPVRRLAGRIKAARSLGFETFVGPLAEGPDAVREQTEKGTAVKDIKEAIVALFGKTNSAQK
jgi:DNA repair protein RadA/Sms